MIVGEVLTLSAHAPAPNYTPSTFPMHPKNAFPTTFPTFQIHPTNPFYATFPTFPMYPTNPFPTTSPMFPTTAMFPIPLRSPIFPTRPFLPPIPPSYGWNCYGPEMNHKIAITEVNLLSISRSHDFCSLSYIFRHVSSACVNFHTPRKAFWDALQCCQIVSKVHSFMNF